jgi:hypothetical protein
MFRLSFINYCQFVTLKFIAGLLWVTGLWTVGVMLDIGIVPPLGLAKAVTLRW